MDHYYQLIIMKFQSYQS